MHAIKLTHHEIEQVIDFMNRTCGNDFTEKDTLVASKMGVLCTKLGYNHFYELWDDAQGSTIASAKVRQQIIDALTTNYSYFYREDTHFSQITDLISTGKLPVGNGELRIWSAGCASGEETYNLAMVLEEARRAGLLSSSYHIVGSDISSKAIALAKEGRYDIADVAHMPTHWRARYCARSGQGFEIKKILRDHVEFRLENVLSPRLDAPFDLVMCRNMMIYFSKEAIERFSTVLRSRVKPEGYLFLGHAEILGTLKGFTYIEPSIWRKDAMTPDGLLDSLANLGIAGYLS